MVPLVNRWFRSSIGLHRNSFVRASRDTPRRVFFDGLEGKRGGCIQGELTPRRPVLPVPAPPRRPAVRCPGPPVVCPGFGFGNSDIRRIFFVRASGETFRLLFTMPRRARGTVVSLANRPVSVPSCPAPRLAAPPPRRVCSRRSDPPV